jgi:DNA-directed RNA polymerase sigma subunit (sigma70/sigma32)
VKATATSRNDAASNALPFLIPREEAALCPDWNESHDVAAPEQLIGSRLHPIAGVAAARRGYGMPTQLRVTEGYTGLMRAACRHYAACAVTFFTYGTLVVQAAQQSILCVAFAASTPSRDRDRHAFKAGAQATRFSRVHIVNIAG